MPSRTPRGRHVSLPPRLSKDSYDQPDKPDNARNDSVCDISASSYIPREFKAQSTVDYAQCNQNASKPDVSIGCCATPTMFLETYVMDCAENGLEE